MSEKDKLFIIDGLGAFVKKGANVTNWSSAPFYLYENQENPENDFAEIIENFKIFAKKASQIGYNAISIDDLAHIVLDGKFKGLYKNIFKICEKNGLKVFVNSDAMFCNKENLEKLFAGYEVEGVITRIGESDGVDVSSKFKSKIIVKTPKQARHYIEDLLPIFEKHNKTWIFRTWTIGVGKIGDLMWNEKTYNKIFSNIKSEKFIVSMKYGQADFFRGLELNHLFFTGDCKKIIELQAKREYDGFGELPFYTGWDYEKYYNQLKNNKNILGIMVWCQTGGWHKSNQLTFLHNSSKWVELNTISTINIFKGSTADKEIENFFGDYKMGEFLKKYYEISGKILQPEKEVKIYFNKLRIPLYFWSIWGNVIINDFTACFVQKYYVKKVSIKEKDLQKFPDLVLYCNSRKALDNYNVIRVKKLFYNILFAFIFRGKEEYRIIDRILFNKLILKIFYVISKKLFPKFAQTQGMTAEIFFK